MSIKNDIFLRACQKEKIDRTPVWIMRQAGRYMHEYRAIREKYNFRQMCQMPEIAAEITLQPVNLIGTDAAIIFSDILVIPEAMGMELEFIEAKGPVFHNPVTDVSVFNNISIKEVIEKLDYVLKAIELTQKELNESVPLIGFCGSPWTLLTYMIEGGSSKNFAKIKSFIYNNPAGAHRLLHLLSQICGEFLSAQIDTGVNAVQIFDSWGGILSKEEYEEFSLRYINNTIAGIKRNNEPVIIFAKGVHHSLKKLSKSGADVLSLDWTMDLGKIREKYSYNVSLQGNLDPTVLFAPEKTIISKTKDVLESYGKGSGHIFNLGHGILPETDPEKVKLLINYVKEESRKYH